MSSIKSKPKAASLLSVTVGLAWVVTGCGAQPTSPGAQQASSTKIVGGQIAKERPFMAGLIDDGYDSSSCGGAFIAPSIVLTAAHCVAEGWHNLRVAGGHRINKQLDETKTAKVLDVAIHESYDSQTSSDDIALLFLKTDELGRFGSRVKPAHPSEVIGLPEATKKATVAGWGALASRGSFPDELLEVTLPIISTSLCKSAGGYYNDVNDREICAGNWDEGGIDSCQGDSGGPLFIEQNGNIEVVGVVSWGEGCAGKHKPGVYTRVASYSSWIKSKIAAQGR